MPTREAVLKAAATFEPPHHIGLVAILSEGVVVLAWDGDEALWSTGKMRKDGLRCAMTGVPLKKGDLAYRPVGNQMYRAQRICAVAIDLLVEVAKRREQEMAEDKVGDNMEPLDNPGDAQFEVGEYVTMSDDAEMYAGERVKIIARGKGSGPFYAGTIVYDIVGEDAEGEDEGDNSWRVRESDIAEVA